MLVQMMVTEKPYHTDKNSGEEKFIYIFMFIFIYMFIYI